MTLDQIEGLKVWSCAFKGLLSCQDAHSIARQHVLTVVGDFTCCCRIPLCSAGQLRKRTMGTPPDCGHPMPCTLGQLSHALLGTQVSHLVFYPV